MKPTRSLHLGALSLSGIGPLIALPAFLLIEILDRNYTGGNSFS